VLDNVLAAAAAQGIMLGATPWSGSRVHSSPYVKSVTVNGTTTDPDADGDVDLGTIAGGGGVTDNSDGTWHSGSVVGFTSAGANTQFAPRSAAWQASTVVKTGQLLHNAGVLYRVTADMTTPSSFNTTNLAVVSGGGSTLAHTGVKTAAYTAAAGDIVPVDASGAARTITLPTAPADKSQVVVKKIDTGNNVVTINCGGSDVFNRAGGSASATLYFTGQSMWMQYDAARSVWTVLADDVPTSVITTFPRMQRWDGVTGSQPGRLVTAPGQPVIWVQPSAPPGAGTVAGGAGMVDLLDIYIAG